MKDNLEILVKKACLGDKYALELVIANIQDLVYNLSLKMLLFPEDAKDATQEILIKVVTHLSTFKHESKFKTWVYRVATNYLLTIKSIKSKEPVISFEEYATLIDTGQSDTFSYTNNEGLLSLLEEEVKISCIHGLLLCLNKTLRIVYILGEILELNSLEGAEILDITPENFRKQLSRSRVKIRNFLNSKCGITNPKNSCRCTKKIDFLISEKKINPNNLQFAQHNRKSIALVSKIESLNDSVSLYKSVPNIKTPEVVIQKIRKVINIVSR